MQSRQTSKLISKLNRKRIDPSKFVFTGHSVPQDLKIQLFKYNSSECIEQLDIPFLTLEKFSTNEFNYWLNIHGINDSETIAEICKKQDIHNLVIDDILDVNQRPKFQEFEKFSFLTLKSILLSENNVVTEQISFVFGSNYLISFQERKSDYFEHLRQRLREGKGIIKERGADYLLFTMLESILDNYFKTLSHLDEEIDKINLTDEKREPSPNILGIIENHKKLILYIKKSILPIKEFTQIVERGECKGIQQMHIKYFLEIKDLCLTLLDNCDILYASLESNINLFFSLQGHRMNQVIKTLTVVSTIFIPLTFVVGIYGMNFYNMPEIEWKYGYVSIWIFMIMIFISMLIYFKSKKWF
jgi:magnesium transporter